MKLDGKTIGQAILDSATSFVGADAAHKYGSGGPPLRSELFNADQLEQHGKTLANLHKLSPRRGPDHLLTRLSENENILIGACNVLTAAVKDSRGIAPAGEWLLDNFYLIEEQIRTAKRHLPKGYSRGLPRLLNGPSAGLPRVYDIALEAISHGDGRVDAEGLSRFVVAYQKVNVLELGELWAIPIMLRLALIENLRRVGAPIAAARIYRNQADAWADQMTEVVAKDPKSLILVLADMARSDPPMVSSFVAELARRLQGRGSASALPLTWIEQRLSESGQTIEQLVQSENQQQATDQASISNSIGSLRFLSAIDWREFVETTSVVERMLREDPAAAYGEMDFATRDRYRHVLERIAKRSKFSEHDVARQAIQLAQAGAAEKSAADRTAHVGYYLIGKGLRKLQRAAQARRSVSESLGTIGGRFPLLLYLGAIALMTAIFTAILLEQTSAGGASAELLVLMAILSLLGTSQLAVALVNWLSTVLATPQPLPRMDFSKGIPPACRTLVVIPTLLIDALNIEHLAEALEVRFLANRDDNLRFGLLTDFEDAHQESLSGDGPLLRLAQNKIDALNHKYRESFFLFHRPRRWNPQERMWMGYERKRGKLSDLNALLRGDAKDRFVLVVGQTDALLNVRYVITLDTDTQLPRDAAHQCVGAMAHPLNRPHFSNASRHDDGPLVTEGYGILQPRVAPSLTGTNRSLYARLCGGESGIDPYTRTVSDVYQDMFGEGSFIGKGIYDVDAFERALNTRFPENRILSHDLLEGCYARSGLLTDVQLVEDYPARYDADVSRRYRWIRGDWQLAGWSLPRPFDRRANPLSALSRWKLFDNLRRSLTPAALTLLLLLGWTSLSPVWFWTLSVIGIILTPALTTLVLELIRKPRDALLTQHLAATTRSAGRYLAQTTFALACLPYEAYYSLDAIVRTATRMWFTHKRLLEWNPSSEHERYRHTGLLASWRSMWIGPALATLAVITLALLNLAALTVAGPILLLWFVAPAVAWWISRPRVRRAATLAADQTIFLQKMARKTWAFFETFVGPQDHWLPPDNFQEYRVALVAHRTSPTNMGLALLANLSAYDFGYIPAGPLIERTANALRSMRQLERHRGHFYNWYDTESLNPLFPLYVSTVDSGNLAGALLTLRQGLLALPDGKILGTRWFDGMRDTLRLLVDTAKAASPSRFTQLQNNLESACDTPPTTLAQAQLVIGRLATDVAEVATGIDAPPESEANRWHQALTDQCRGALDELTLLAPWSALSAAPHRFSGLADRVEGMVEIPSLRQLARLETQWLPAIEQWLDADTTPEERHWLSERQRLVMQASACAQERIATIERLALETGDLGRGMEHDFLFDSARKLFTIGYNVSERRRDSSCYDLLASEARLSSFIAIAHGRLPQESWFALGRQLTRAGGEPVLLSWSGSMFEYLMPLLIMPTYANTLLDQTYRAAVARQIAYGDQRDVPWGMSESGYNRVDASLNYQYRAFGVPGLGLKRGLAEDLVIAPYASALALMVAPTEACSNLQRLAANGLEGRFGFYEAIDYTPSRQRRGQASVVVQSFMAHHQGMIFLSLAYHLLNRPMQKHFESDPAVQATALLLQERIPKATAFQPHATKFSDTLSAVNAQEMPVRVFDSPHTPIPEVQLLSNGNYHVMVTNAGGGYSRWKDLAVTRWREDSTRDNWGTFCYLRDLASGEFWSTTHQPTLKQPQNYQAIFSEGRAEFRRRDHGFETHTEIAVSPEDDIELRRLRITNTARTRRTIDVTSYAEVVLATPASDALHPTFSNLFVQTEVLRERQAILCHRRARSRDEQTPWMLHLMAVHGTEPGHVSYETDRMQFMGRGHSSAAPRTMSDAAPLSGSQGSVLDPIVAIRCRITLEPEQSATIDMVSGIGTTRDAALSLIGRYQDRHLADRVFDLASTHGSVTLRQINATESDAQLYGCLAGSVIYTNSSLRADAGVLVQNRRGQSGLWGYAISGDLPIVLLKIGDVANIGLVRQLVQAHAYWRLKGLTVDLVIWNEDHSGYRQELHEQITSLIAVGVGAHLLDRPGGIFVRRAEQISNEDRVLFQTVARAIIADSRGTLAEQINARGAAAAPTKLLAVLPLPTLRSRRAELAPAVALPRRDLILGNGLGGFTPDGREYVITTTPGRVTPTPWVNVLANPTFGSVISESGVANTWSENAHEFRLTPWGNDPVSDSGGEAFYLRDEETGHFWSPTPLPCRAATPYVSRHGFGYSVFEHTEDGIESELWVYVAIDAPIKFAVLKVRNPSGRPRRLSATGYVEWVLGNLRPQSMPHIITEIDADDSGRGALLARNRYSTEFAGRVAFLDVDEAIRTVSGDRNEFIGRNGTLSNPAAMRRAQLSGKVGAALDPCAAIQVPFELADGQEREIVFRLGAGRDAADARHCVQRFRGSFAARGALEAVWEYWNRTLGAVQVETPDPSINVLANGWLLYQTLACRLWARSGFYQPGGAFGFRDQLQDAMALVHAEPRLLRAHLLLCASRQFPQGDVQHWWHPPSGRGVRTNCSDDYLWLPLATCRYVLTTGDVGILDESCAFIEGRALNPGEDSYYDLPNRSDETATLYQHGVRAILKGLRFGEHGLPLMGSGDWNDGMNLVGLQGKGESIWLGFFLHEVLSRFADIARRQGDLPFVERCHTEADRLRRNIEASGWDGAWYRRAYFDDGTPLGSSSNDECQIDSIAQSWAVLSGAGDPTRARLAMEAVDKRLVRRDAGLIQLLDPPFDKSPLDPGYIKGYVPGVRENGGQYTHGAIWAAMAFAALGDRQRAWDLTTLINPVNHSRSPESTAVYKVEPYVMAADVYGLPPHTGRGGWTWYSGSAGWMYRLITESLLGLKLEVDRLHIAPCLPSHWKTFTLHYRYRETVYHIVVSQTRAADDAKIDETRITVDGVERLDNAIPLIDDRQEHSVEVRVRAPQTVDELTPSLA